MTCQKNSRMRVGILVLSASLAVMASTIITTTSGTSNNRVVDFDCGFLIPDNLRYNVRYDPSSRNISGSAKIRVEKVPMGPNTLDADATNGYLYVGSDSPANGGIYRYNLDGSNQVTISNSLTRLPNGSSWQAHVLRVTATHLYWVAETPWASQSTLGWTINRLPLSDFTQVQQLWNGGRKVAMDLDRTNNKIYFIDKTLFFRMDFDGSNLNQLPIVEECSVFSCTMAVIPSKNQIWWTQSTQGLWKMNMDGTGQTSFSTIKAPFDTSGGGAFYPFFPDIINAMRYDSVDDALYFASDDYLMSGPVSAATPQDFWAGMTVKLDLRYMQTSDFVLGWSIPSRGETACRVPCDLPTNQCNGRGMCRFHAVDVTQTQCLCPKDPPILAPKVVWGPHCSYLSDPCTPTAVKWDGSPLCVSPYWRTRCSVDSEGNKTYLCQCPIYNEEYTYLGGASFCMCPANNPVYVSLPGPNPVACGACQGATCVCKSTDQEAVFSAVLSACACVNSTECSSKVCAREASVSAGCKSAMTTMRFCFPNFNKTSEHLLLAAGLLKCERQWFDIPGVAPTPLPGSPTPIPGAPTPVNPVANAAALSMPSIFVFAVAFCAY